jgi:hypothetical protein
VIAIGVCLALLSGLFVIGGADLLEDPEASPGIGIEAPTVAPAANAGAHVETSGVVVNTDPVVIEIETDTGGTDRLQLEHAPRVEEGQVLSVSGTLTEAGTLEVHRERAVTKEPWELAYMYLISVVGALVVAAAGIDSWRFDRRTLSVEPRETPLHEAHLDRGEAEDA